MEKSLNNNADEENEFLEGGLDESELENDFAKLDEEEEF